MQQSRPSYGPVHIDMQREEMNRDNSLKSWSEVLG